jgi:HD superfamily phosphohydrolase
LNWRTEERGNALAKIIRDVLYGFIELDDQECEIINSPYFQRLRRIKQLSLTNMIYPGAVHTRFEHSIGVMRMASDMFDVISKKYGALLDDYKINKSGLDRSRKVIRMAALLHDVGHAPFSHSGENLFPIRDGENRYKHEEYSIAIIKQKFTDIINNHPDNFNNYGIRVEQVTELLGDQNIFLSDVSALNPSVSSIFWKELISGSIDADRADYLLRDSYHLGVKYGHYDNYRLVQFMAAATTETGALSIVVDEKGWMAAESLVLARYYMFSQVYFHKIRRVYDYHLYHVIKEVLRLKGEAGGCFPPPTEIDRYLAYDDWTIYSSIINDQCGEHGKIIRDRKHYKCLHDVNSPDDADLVRTKEQYKDMKDGCWYDDKAATAWYKMNNDIQILHKNNKMKPLSEKSQLIKQLLELSNNVANVRFYIDRARG